MKKLKVGIIGCGAIGSAIAKAVTKDFKQYANLSYVSEHHPEKIAALQKKLAKGPQEVPLKKLISNSDLIIEAASGKVATFAVEEALKKNKQVMVLSTGGILKIKKLKSLLDKTKGKLWIPSGAIAGIDGLLAAMEGKVLSVKLITKKPPKGIMSAPYFEKHSFPQLKGEKEIRVFKGNVTQAIQGFPKNVNVGAILSLAGIGSQKTQVEIWTSKAYRRNQHEVLIRAESGTMKIQIQNKPSKENAKTSALAFMSAIATLRRVFTTYRIGT